jgi:hypothetical protein
MGYTGCHSNAEGTVYVALEDDADRLEGGAVALEQI